MSDLKGTIVLAPVVPSSDDRSYPTHIAEFGKGGLHSVADLTDRDAIPAERRTEGMLVYVSAIGRTFQLKGGIDNGNWQELQAAGGSGGGSGDMSQYIYDTNGDGIVDHAALADQASKALQVDWAGVVNAPTKFAPTAHTHPATDIIIDSGHEFVTQTEKDTWNAKADAANVYTKTETDTRIQAVVGAAPAALDTLKEIADALGNDANLAADLTNQLANKVDKVAGMGLSANDFTSAEKTKLAGLTNYVAPSSYPATMIQTDMNHEFVTDTQINSWTNKQDALGFVPENTAKKGIANGYASLDSTGKVPVGQLPQLAFNSASVVADAVSRAAITGQKAGDIAYETSTGDSYIWDGSIWKLMADKDWQNINIDWSNLTGKPGSSVAAIDTAVLQSHTHVNKAILDATEESFTTALKNKIGDADSIKSIPVDMTGATNGYSLIYSNGKIIPYPIAEGSGGSGTGDMLASVYDTNGNGIVDVAESANSVAWSNIQSKPSTFPIAAHKSTHAIGGSDVLSPADIGAALATDLTAHTNNMSNPHNTTKAQIGLSNVTNDAQVKRTEMGVASGVATLDTSGKVPQSQLPALAVNNTFVVATQADMLALAAVQGDVAIRTDVSKSYILQTYPPTTLSNWQELLAPTGTGIQTVNGQTGTSVTLTTTNVAEGSNLYYTDARVTANPTVSAHIANMNNPHNTTKTQIGLSNVTNDAQVKRTEMGVANGVASLGADGKVPASQLPASGGGGAVTSVNSKVGDVVLNTSDIAESTNLYYTDVRVDARILANSTVSSMSSHITNTSNPHSVTKTQVGLANVTNDAQVKRTEMGTANGVATLGADGKVVSSQLPATVINNTYVVASQTAMLALTANIGDIAIRTDVSKSFVLGATPASTLANWNELLAPTGSGIQTINGVSGPNATITTSNVAEGTNLYYTDARVAAAPALTGHINNTSNPHSVTKAQVGLGSVDNVQQIPMSQKGAANGVATLGSDGKVPSSQLPASGGGGSTISRYEASGSTGGQCIVTASGTGVTFSIGPGACTITAPAGVELLSAKVYVSATNASGTSFNVTYNAGDSTQYTTTIFPSMIQILESSKAVKAAATFNYAVASNVAQVTGLTAGQSFWLKLVF